MNTNLTTFQAMGARPGGAFRRMLAVLLAFGMFSNLATPASTNDLTTILQKGLFEEEANRNLDAAIQAYQSVAAQFDKDRKLAATAVFRLGECYRKAGNPNAAAAQYQRVLRDFSDQQTLVTLSRQNLSALGAAVVEPVGPGPAEANPKAEAAARAGLLELQTRIQLLKSLSKERLRIAIQQEFPNPVLTSLMQKLADAEQNLAALKREYGPNHLEVLKAGALEDTINQQIEAQVQGVLTGLELKQAAAAKAVTELQAQAKAILGSGQNATSVSGSATVTSAEAEEIKRIQEMIRNSPDLINARAGSAAPLHQAAEAGQMRVAGFLLENGADVNVKNDAGCTPLLLAAAQGHKAMVELLLDYHAAIEVANKSGVTPLQAAARRGFKAVAEVLLARGARVDSVNTEGRTALHQAVQSGSQPLVELLLAKKADANAEDRQGLTPLSLAAEKLDVPILKALLDAGANPNAGRQDLPLSVAAFNGDLASLDLLLAHGADPNLRGRFGTQFSSSTNPGEPLSALFVAVRAYRPDVVSRLIQSKADPNGWPEGRLLFLALNEIPTLTALLNGGAKADACNESGEPALVLAVRSGMTNATEVLVKHGASLNLTNNLANTAIHYAVGQQSLLECLVAAGAEVNVRNKNGETPLHWAAGAGLKDAVTLLLSHGAKPNLQDVWGNTPLHLAAVRLRQDAKVVELLLAGGADANLRNHAGLTPLDYALHHPNYSLAQLAPGVTVPGDINQSPAMPGLPPPGFPARPGLVSPNSTANPIADALKRHGALVDLPRLDRIELRRSSANFSANVFMKGANDWNQFTLVELLAVHYHFLADSPSQGEANSMTTPDFLRGEGRLSFPDLGHIRIRHPGAGPSNWSEETADLTALFQDGDCSKDFGLGWGDVVDVPELDHPLNELWPGLSTAELTNLAKCLTRQIRVVIKGQATNLTLNPKIVVPNEIGRRFGLGGGQILPTIRQDVPFWLKPALNASGLLLASSDLSRIKVTRPVPSTGQKREYVVDCREGQPAPDLWLRDGDIIEVPDK